MAYVKQDWVDNTTVITAARMNHIEDGILNEQVGPQGPQGEPGPAGTNGTNGAKGDPGANGLSVKAISLTTDVDGKVTGGIATLTDDSTITITVTTA